MNYDDVAMNSAIEYLRQAKEKLWGTGIDGSDLEEEGLAAKAAIEAKISDAEASLAGIDTNISLESTTIPSFGAALDSGIVGTSVEDFSFEKLTPEMQTMVNDTLSQMGNLTDIQREKALENPMAIAFISLIYRHQQEIAFWQEALAEFENKCMEVDGVVDYNNPSPEVLEYFTNYCKESGIPEEEIKSPKETKERITILKQDIYNATIHVKQLAYSYLDDIPIEEIDESSALLSQDEPDQGKPYGEFLDFLNWGSYHLYNFNDIRTSVTQNFTNKMYIDQVPHLIVLNFLWNNEGYCDYLKKEKGIEELTKEDLVKYYFLNCEANSIESLQIRAFLYMNDEERNKYYYLFSTEGMDVANDYLNSIEDQINQRFGMELAFEDMISIMQTSNGYVRNFESFCDGFESGLSNFFDNMLTMFNGNTTLTVTEYRTMYLNLYYASYIQPLSEEQKEAIELAYQNGELEITEEEYAQLMNTENLTTLDLMFMTGEMSEDLYTEWQEIKKSAVYQEFLDYLDTNADSLNLWYNVGMTTGYIAPTIMISTMLTTLGCPPIVGKIAGGSLNFASSYGSNYKTNIRNGNQVNSSSIAAFFAATGEAGLEFFLGRLPGLSKAEDIIDLTTDVTRCSNVFQVIGARILKVGGNVGIEIGEELGQDLYTKIVNSVVLGEPIEITPEETWDTVLLTGISTFILSGPTNLINLGSDVYNYYNFNQNRISFDLGNGQTVSYTQDALNEFYDADTGVLDLEAFAADFESKTGLELGKPNVSKVQITDPTIATPPTISEQQSSRIQNVMKEMDLRLGNGKGLELLTHYVETGDISEISAVGFRENLLEFTMSEIADAIKEKVLRTNITSFIFDSHDVSRSEMRGLLQEEFGLTIEQAEAYINCPSITSYVKLLLNSSSNQAEVSSDYYINQIAENYGMSYEQAEFALKCGLQEASSDLITDLRTELLRDIAPTNSVSNFFQNLFSKNSKDNVSAIDVTVNAFEKAINSGNVLAYRTLVKLLRLKRQHPEMEITYNDVPSQENLSIQSIIDEITLKLGNGKGLELLTHYVETGDINEISAVGFRENLLEFTMSEIADAIKEKVLRTNITSFIFDSHDVSRSEMHGLLQEEFGLTSEQAEAYINCPSITSYVKMLLNSSSNQAEVSSDYYINQIAENYDIPYEQAELAFKYGLQETSSDLITDLRTEMLRDTISTNPVSNFFQKLFSKNSNNNISLIDYTINAFEKAINSGNVLAFRSLVRFLQLKRQNSEIGIDYEIKGLDSHTNKSKIKFSKKDVEGQNYQIFFHELGHLLFYNADQYSNLAFSKINKILENLNYVKMNSNSISVFLKNFENQARTYANELFIKTYGMSLDEYIQFEVDNSSPKFYIKNVNEILKLFKEIYSNNKSSEQSIQKSIQQVFDLLNSKSQTEINLILTRRRYKNLWIKYYSDFIVKNSAYSGCSDIISACFGTMDNIPGINRNLKFGHTKGYYQLANHKKVHEIMANFFAISVLSPENLSTVKLILGEQIYTMFEDLLHNFFMNTEFLKSTYIDRFSESKWYLKSDADELSNTLDMDPIEDSVIDYANSSSSLDTIVKSLDSRWQQAGIGIKTLKAYIDPNNQAYQNLQYITSEGGARDLIKTIPIEHIEMYLKEHESSNISNQNIDTNIGNNNQSSEIAQSEENVDIIGSEEGTNENNTTSINNQEIQEDTILASEENVSNQETANTGEVEETIIVNLNDNNQSSEPTQVEETVDIIDSEESVTENNDISVSNQEVQEDTILASEENVSNQETANTGEVEETIIVNSNDNNQSSEPTQVEETIDIIDSEEGTNESNTTSTNNQEMQEDNMTANEEKVEMQPNIQETPNIGDTTIQTSVNEGSETNYLGDYYFDDKKESHGSFPFTETTGTNLGINDIKPVDSPIVGANLTVRDYIYDSIMKNDPYADSERIRRFADSLTEEEVLYIKRSYDIILDKYDLSDVELGSDKYGRLVQAESMEQQLPYIIMKMYNNFDDKISTPTVEDTSSSKTEYSTPSEDTSTESSSDSSDSLSDYQGYL